MNAVPLAREATAVLADLSGGGCPEIGAGYNPERQSVVIRLGGRDGTSLRLNW